MSAEQNTNLLHDKLPEKAAISRPSNVADFLQKFYPLAFCDPPSNYKAVTACIAPTPKIWGATSARSTVPPPSSSSWSSSVSLDRGQCYILRCTESWGKQSSTLPSYPPPHVEEPEKNQPSETESHFWLPLRLVSVHSDANDINGPSVQKSLIFWERHCTFKVGCKW